MSNLFDIVQGLKCDWCKMRNDNGIIKLFIRLFINLNIFSSFSHESSESEQGIKT